jgi:hypothetical protein
MGSIVEDICNLLADMPLQDLPVVQFLYDPAILNCVAVFPLSGRGTDLFFDGGSTTMGAIDKPSVQIQVRYTNPQGAFARCEAIRKWLDQNAPTGYVSCITNRDQPSNVTSPEDIASIGGPMYRYSVDFAMSKVRT